VTSKRKLSHCEGVLSVRNLSFLREDCCKKCGMALPARKRVCDMYCKVEGANWKHTILRKVAVVKDICKSCDKVVSSDSVL
jgi:hypothetical protein